MNIERKLSEEFESQMEGLHKIELGTDAYKVTVDGVTKIADRIIELKKIEVEREEKSVDRDVEESLKTQEMKELKKDRIVRNVIEGAKVVVPVVGAFAMGIISMKWEKVDTLTSSAGKASLREILRFK